MYGSVLSMKFVILDHDHYTGHIEGQKTLTEPQFELVAELETVLFPLYVLIQNVQTDALGSLSYSFLHFFCCYVQYQLQHAWMVANVSKLTNRNKNNWWNGNAKFPKQQMTGKIVAGEPSEGKKVVNLIRKETKDMSDLAQKLIKRIAVDFKRYGGLPTDLQLLAMAVNPLSSHVGFPVLGLEQKALKIAGVTDSNQHRDF
jgi:hypothetical protein